MEKAAADAAPKRKESSSLFRLLLFI